jgi:leucyl/phenylalanyl-tRNA---protein transferase
LPVYQLIPDLIFPPPEHAEPDGLLAVGGDLSVERLLLAYRSGIFPWFEGQEPLWYSPDPRFVLFPEKLKISKSMKQMLKRQDLSFSIDQHFSSVIRACQQISRQGQDGTWITEEMLQAYQELHRLGYAHSAECLREGKLIGGLYGVRIGNFFFGESMFHHESNASKYAFINYVQQLQQEGVVMIDCQVYTEHLESLGAEHIPRKLFLELIRHI